MTLNKVLITGLGAWSVLLFNTRTYRIRLLGCAVLNFWRVCMEYGKETQSQVVMKPDGGLPPEKVGGTEA